jgi:hypothetical protein
MLADSDALKGLKLALKTVVEELSRRGTENTLTSG